MPLSLCDWHRWFTSYRWTFTISLIAVVLWMLPSVSGWLETDFSNIGEGQWWRIWTGHLVHYDGNHLMWDLLMFVTLGSLCEREHRRAFGIAVLGIAGVITVGLAFFCPDLGVYRGLSGIDTGLFVWFVADQIRNASQSGDRKWLAGWCVALVGLVSKLVFEATTGQTLFVDSSGFTPLVESHLIGVAAGFSCAVLVERLGRARWRVDPKSGLAHE